MSNLKLALTLIGTMFLAVVSAEAAQLAFDHDQEIARIEKQIKLDELTIQLNVLREKLISEEIDNDGKQLEALVAPNVPANPVQCMADNIYFEAALEPYEGQLAVAQVVINRLNNPTYPHSICGVIYYKKVNPNTGKKEAAFSWTLGRKWRPRGINHQIYQECIQLARAVLTNHLRSGIIGPEVEHYHANYISPPWKNNYEMVAQIGQHIFYR